MRQFILPEDISTEHENGRFSLYGEYYHYLINVLRRDVGDTIPGIDGTGNRYQLTIRKIVKNELIIDYSRIEFSSLEEPKVSVCLFQCMPKGKKIDTIIRQATEANVNRIIPLVSQNSVSKPDRERGNQKLPRWQKIIVEASQQCGRTTLPQISLPVNFEKGIDELSQMSLGLFFHQSPLENSSLHGYLSKSLHDQPAPSIGLVIGPEGGLSDSEVKLLQAIQYKPVFLGPSVLRTETAAIYALGAVQTILWEKETWQSVKE